MSLSQFKEDGEQQTASWLYERCGHVTASRFKDVIAVTKKNWRPAAARQAYLWEIVIERLTGQPAEHYTSAAMQWGTEQEEFSRMAYEARTGEIVTQVGFLKHPTLPMVGGSPDGLIGDDGGWESKSPYNSANHLQCFLARACAGTGMPEEHMPQVQGLMGITNRQWWIFCSFDPRMPAALQLYIERIERDQAFIDAMEAQIVTFLAEVADVVAELKAAS